MGKQAVRSGMGFSLAVFFLWLIFRQLRFAEIQQAFTGAIPSWIIVALVAFAVGYSCRIARWHLSLRRDNPELRWWSCAGPLLASFAANNVFPLRAGDVLRAFAFNQKLGTTAGVVIATLFVERLLDLLMVLVLLGLALAFFGLDSHRFAGVGSVILILAGVAILIILLFPSLFRAVSLIFARMIERIAPKLGRKLHDEINNGFATLQHLSQGGIMIKLIAWSALVWLAEGCVFWFSALALPSVIAPLASWLALPVSTLATLIPSTPGYVGSFDFFTIRSMTELGNGTGAATAYAFLVHVVLWLPPTLSGGLYLLFHPVQQPDTTKALRT